ncbi:MAG: ASCH domain-containing protein [Mariprofundaceae bacterium]|nr:ASCH domain-containing protein [Mariprofundaceae bacterium]
MNQYPDKTCEIENLVRHPKLKEAAIAGKKTQQRRDGVYAYPGEEFELDGIPFEVTSLLRETLGDMNDSSAQAEGYPNLAMYKALILSMHKGMEWDESTLVWVHSFKRINSK